MAVCRSDVWYRAEFLNLTTPGNCQVFLVDIGEQIEIETVKVQPLDKRFGKEPMLAITAEIDGIVFPMSDTVKADLTSILMPTKGAEGQLSALVMSIEPPSLRFSFRQTDVTMVLKQKQKQREGVKALIGTIIFVEPSGGIFLMDSSKRQALEVSCP